MSIKNNMLSRSAEELRRWFDGLPVSDKILCTELMGGGREANLMYSVEGKRVVHEAWMATHKPGRMAADVDLNGLSRLSGKDIGVMKTELTKYAASILRLPGMKGTVEGAVKLGMECIYDENEWYLLGRSYLMGHRKEMELRERPCPDNDFIGGKTEWSRFNEIKDGPRLGDGTVTGIGHIDYKDCTNTYLVIDGDRKAVSIYDTDRFSRSVVLGRVMGMWLRRSMKKANVKGLGL